MNSVSILCFARYIRHFPGYATSYFYRAYSSDVFFRRYPTKWDTQREMCSREREFVSHLCVPGGGICYCCPLTGAAGSREPARAALTQSTGSSALRKHAATVKLWREGMGLGDPAPNCKKVLTSRQ